MESPIQLLVNRAHEMKELATAYRSMGTTGPLNDVPDVLEIASSLIMSVISNANTNKLELQGNAVLQEIDDILNVKERQFITKMENLINSSGQKVTDVAGALERVQQKYHETIEKLTKIYEGIVQKEKDKLEAKIADQEQLWEIEKKNLTEEENKLYRDLEQISSKVLGEISQKYNEKINDIDQKIKEQELMLQGSVHQRHQQNQIKSDLLAEEERRMAAEHEKISRDYQQRHNKAVEEATKLEAQIQELKMTIESESANSQSRIQRMEESMKADFQRRQDDLQILLTQYSEHLKFLEAEDSSIQQSHEYEKTTLETRLARLQEEYEEKIGKEQRSQDEAVAVIRQNLESQYKVIFDSIADEMNEEDVKRGKQLDEYQQQKLQRVKQAEKELRELGKANEREKVKMQKVVADAKERLKAVKEQRNIDISELKQARQSQLGAHMQELDDIQHKQALELNRIFKAFDEQQKRLGEVQRKSVGMKNKQKMETVAAMRKEHERRKQAIIEEIDQQREDETQEEVQKRIDEMKKSGPVTMESLDKRQGDLKTRMDKIMNKIDSLIEKGEEKNNSSSSAVQMPLQTSNSQNKLIKNEKKQESPARSSQKILPLNPLVKQEDSEEEISKLAQISQRSDVVQNEDVNNELRRSIQDANRRRNSVLEESKSLRKDISDLSSNFENKFLQIEHQFHATKSSLTQKKELLINQENYISNNVMNQEKKLDELDKRINLKNQIVEEMEQVFEKDKEEFTEKIKKEQEAKLEAARGTGEEAELMMYEVRMDFQSRMAAINEKLANAKLATEKITAYMLKSRAQAIEEAQTELTVGYDEKVKFMNEQHKLKLQQYDNDVNNKKKEFEDEVSKTKEETDEKSVEAEKTYLERKSELEEERQNLMNELDELEKKLNELLNTECKDCVRKKGILAALLQKKKGLETKIEDLHEVSTKLEYKMNAIFGNERKPFKVMSPRLLVPRAKTAQAQAPPRRI